MFIFSLACTFTIAMKFTAITAARRPPASDTDATNDRLPLFQKCLLFYARIPAWPSMSNNSFVQWVSFIGLLLLLEIRREFLGFWERLKSVLLLVYRARYSTRPSRSSVTSTKPYIVALQLTRTSKTTKSNTGVIRASPKGSYRYFWG